MSNMVRRILTCLLATASTASAQTISGTVISRSTQQPVAQVGVRLIAPNGAAISSAITEAYGKFAIGLPASGTFHVVAERFAFKTHFSQPFTAAGTSITYNIELQDSVIALTPLTVPAEVRSRRLESVGLYERAKAAQGAFILREEIEKRQAQRISQLLQGRAGLRLQPVSRSPASGITRGDLVMRGGSQASLRGAYCFPRVYVDGVLARPETMSTPTLALDEIANPEEIEAIEVYRSASQVPSQYSGAGSSCGAVLIWTRIK
jgi:hypothetical protein